MKRRSIFISIGLASAILTGCGSSSSPSNENTGTGYYIDSAVSGVSYVCGTQSGVTGNDGSFTFEKGKSCTFKLGDIILREVIADNLKEEVKIVEDRVEVAIMLQTMDKDGDPSNGITIPANVVQAMVDAGITKLPENDNDVAAIYEAIKASTGYSGEAKTEEQTKAHMQIAQGEQLKELLGGKTFYIAYIDDGIKSIEKLVFNKDVTSLVWSALLGSDKGDTEISTVSLEGNKLIFDNGSNLKLNEQKSDYLLMDRYKDGSADGDEEFFFTQAKAEAYLENLKDDDKHTNNLEDLKFTTNWLNGRTLYNTYNDDGWDIAIFEFTDTQLSYYSENTPNDKTTKPYTITDAGVIRFANPWIEEDGEEFAYIQATAQTDDYIENDDGEHYFFDHQKAVDFISSVSNPVTVENAISQAMLDGKTFYYSFPVANGSTLYGKKTFTSDTTGAGHKIIIDTDGAVVQNITFDISYVLENGQQKVYGANENLLFKLIGIDADKWDLTKEVDADKDGNYETTNNSTWYLSKPAHYPEELKATDFINTGAGGGSSGAY